jgi:hypothetical protein
VLRAHSSRERHAVACLALLVLSVGCNSTSVDPVEEACREVDCGPGRCVLDTSGPACLCDAGHHAEGLRCVASSCTPNPCTEPHRTVCTQEAASFQCSCDPGYVWKDNACIALTRPSCSADPWPGGDAAEPDDCPERAGTEVVLDSPVGGHTLAPAGDVDWYRLPTLEGRIYRLRVVGASEEARLYLDVLTAKALEPVAANHRGLPLVELTFKAPTSEPLLLRLSAFDSTTSPGAYTLSLSEEPLTDDFADTAAGAEPLPAGGVVSSGGLQFPGDVDVHALTLEASTSAMVDAVIGPDSMAPLLLELVAPDGTTVLNRRSGSPVRLFIHVRDAGRYLLRVRAENPTYTGDYRLVFQRLGPDDHGDDETIPTSVAMTSTLEGRLERAGDEDVFTFSPTARHTYNVRCSIPSGGWCETRVFRVGQLPTGPYSSDTTFRAGDATPHLLLVHGSTYLNTTGAYRITITDLGVDDHADSPAGATPMTVGGPSVSGKLLLGGDVDAFTFTLEALRIYRFQCDISSYNPYGFRLTLMDPIGTPVEQGSSLLTFLARSSGPHVMLASGGSFESTPYTCQLSALGTDDHGNTREQASALPTGAGTGAHQYIGDVDVFSAPTLVGRIYRATLSPSQSSLTLLVSDANGENLATVSGSAPTTADFKATTATTVLSVGNSSYPPSGGTYSVKLEELAPDDHGDTPETATPVTLSAPFSGTLGFTGDTDTFSFSLAAGRVYRLRCSSGSSWNAPYVRLRDSTGGSVSSGQVALLYEVNAGGTYSADVYRGSGAYECMVEDVGTDDHPDTAVGALELSPLPASGTGVLETHKDVDVFTFRPTEGRIYRVSCGLLSSCGLRLRGPDGAVLAERSTDVSSGTTLAWEATDVPLVSLEVAVAYSTGTYSYQLEDVGTDDHGDLTSTATDLGTGTVSVGAVLGSHKDVDVFAFAATAGHIYRVRCVPGSLRDCGLKIRDPSGQEVSPPFESVVSGRHTIEVSGGWSNGVGTYTLHLENLGPDDHADTASGATVLTPGTPATAGRLETFDDVDVFVLSATAPRFYRLTCAPDNEVSGCKLRVRDATGNLVAESESYPSTLSFGATRTGPMTVELTSGVSQRAGTYTLRLEDLGLDDYGNTQATAAPLSLSTPVVGQLESPTDIDVFSLSLKGGQRYEVVLTTGASFLLSVRTDTGAILPLEFASSFKPTTSGTYYLHLESGSTPGPYQLQVRPAW